MSIKESSIIIAKHLLARIRRCASVIVKTLIPGGGALKDKFKVIRSTYSWWQFRKITNEKRLIRIYTKTSVDRPGLADRLKAFLGCYVIAEESGYRFYIYHDAGFDLADYLEPNEVDWRIEKKNIHWGINRFKIEWFLTQFIQLNPQYTEYHPHFTWDVIGNLPEHLQHKYSFSATYNKLFKPSSHLKNLMNKVYQELGLIENQYIAVHVRFLDYFEAVEQNPADTPFIKLASEEEQAAMVKSIHATLDVIHEEKPGMPILLFSDSSKFMNMPHPDYVLQLSGEVGHIHTHQDNLNVTDKALTDLYAIAGANKVISIVGPDLYTSGYCKTAALMGDKPFVRVERILSL